MTTSHDARKVSPVANTRKVSPVIFNPRVLNTNAVMADVIKLILRDRTLFLYGYYAALRDKVTQHL